MTTDSPLKQKLAAARTAQIQRQRESSDQASARSRRNIAFDQILKLLVERPGLNWNEIKQATGLSTRVVRDTLWAMVKAKRAHYRIGEAAANDRRWFSGKLPEEFKPC